MNLVTLCPTCHALAHGMNLIGVDYTQEDVEQCIVGILPTITPDWDTGGQTGSRSAFPASENGPKQSTSGPSPS